MNGTGLKKVVDLVTKCLVLPPPKPNADGTTTPHPPLPVFLVFVVQSNVMLGLQRIKSGKGVAMQDLVCVKKQFSLALGMEFDPLVRMVAEAHAPEEEEGGEEEEDGGEEL